MDVKQLYKQLISEYLELGGNQSFINKLPSIYSLQNEAKIRAELRKLKQKKPSSVVVETFSTLEKPTENIGSKKAAVIKPTSELKSIGLISEYPVELHTTYFERKDAWIKACSLKIQLNDVAIENEAEALKLQIEIHKCVDVVDSTTKELLYYKTYKRVLPKEVTSDFSKLTDAELLQKRNNIRSNISNRKKTIEKIKEELNTADEKAKFKLKDKLSKKIEQLEEFQLQINKINDLLAKEQKRD